MSLPWLEMLIGAYCLWLFTSFVMEVLDVWTNIEWREYKLYIKQNWKVSPAQVIYSHFLSVVYFAWNNTFGLFLIAGALLVKGAEWLDDAVNWVDDNVRHYAKRASMKAGKAYCKWRGIDLEQLYGRSDHAEYMAMKKEQIKDETLRAVKGDKK